MKTHRPAFNIGIVLIFGILAGKFLLLPYSIWITILAAASALAFLEKRSWVIYLGVFCLGAVLIINAYRLPADSIAFLTYDERQQITVIEGVVDSKPQIRALANGSQIIVDLQVLRVLLPAGWVKKSGKVQARFYKNLDISYGQQLRVSGKLHAVYNGKPGDKFSYRQYLRDQGVYWGLSVGNKETFKLIAQHRGNFFVEAALNLRFKIKSVFERLLDPSQEGMISAMVLGDRGGIAKDLKQVFVNTGTAHIIAISGMNMSIIAIIVFFIFKCCGFPRRWQLIATSLFLFTYAFITGWSPSVVRASLMASVFLFSFAWELEGDALNSLGLAAFVLLLIDSTHLFDIGFQLSFAAVLAILLLFKPCGRMLAFLPKLLATPMAVSLAAWVGTAPFIFYHFNMITPVSIIANIPIVPLADLTVALGLGLGVTGLVGDWLALPFAGCLKAVFNLMVILAAWFDKIPWGHFNVG